MEQILSHSQQQKLKMNPQLAQAIQILQLSSLELQDLVAKEYEENPLLEIEENSHILMELNKTKEIIQQFSKDDEKPTTYANDEVILPIADRKTLSLEAYVVEQINYTSAPEPVKKLAQYLAGLLDEAGYLAPDLTGDFQGQLKDLFPQALALLQSLEPYGIGASNLQECLILQAKAKGIYQGLLQIILDSYLNKLGENRLGEIAKELGIEPKDVQEVQDTIRRELHPKPGIFYNAQPEEYIIPDIFIKVKRGTLEISFNETTTPTLKISNLYLQDNLDPSCQAYVKERLQAALNLIKAIEQRRQTLTKVVEEISKQQEAVFTQGFTALKPLQMKQVAQAIDVHESTVSRAVANKYINTPFGTVPLKDFFSAANISSATGEEVATLTIKQRLKTFIQGENPTKPLSDEKLTQLLKAEGHNLSRRTVMKYREQLGFPSSAKRKRF